MARGKKATPATTVTNSDNAAAEQSASNETVESTVVEAVVEDAPVTEAIKSETAPEVSVTKVETVAEPKAKAVAKVKTVSMVRDVEQYQEAPHSADVHPDEVENYKAGGWTEAK